MKLSIGVIAYNEQDYLPALLDDLRSQMYPHELIEIVLVDSMSTDNTYRIMEEFKANNDFYSVQVLSNPDKIQSAGWNVAIENFTGDVLAQIDAHAKLTPEYSVYVMTNIDEGENVVGGLRPCIIEKDTNWANVLLQVENSLFGSSINFSRRSLGKAYVKTMFHAAYRREVLDNVGLFNEKLLRTEDNEFHYRIRAVGYKLCYDPRILSYQYMRSSFKAMLSQKSKNGFWIGQTIKVCPQCISIYHLIPATFVLGIVITTLLIPIFWTLSALMWTLYGSFAILNSVISVVKNGFYPQSLLMPFLFLILHVYYGVGTLIGLLSSR